MDGSVQSSVPSGRGLKYCMGTRPMRCKSTPPRRSVDGSQIASITLYPIGTASHAPCTILPQCVFSMAARCCMAGVSLYPSIRQGVASTAALRVSNAVLTSSSPHSRRSWWRRTPARRSVSSISLDCVSHPIHASEKWSRLSWAASGFAGVAGFAANRAATVFSVWNIVFPVV